MSLLEYLKSKGYTDDEIVETEIRLSNNMELPEEVLNDLKEFWRSK